MEDALGDRMKRQYENRTRYFLPRRTYTIIRLDGRAFHTFTRDMQRPFDQKLIDTMNSVTKYLCENIMGTVLGYTQSDEITLLLTDFKDEKAQAYFDGNIQKITSVSAGMASAKFTQDFGKLAVFDARVFTIPDSVEVANNFIWRQNDATRNSIQMIAQSLYSQEELKGKSFADVNKLLLQKGHNFDTYHSHHKRGRVVRHETYEGDYMNPKTGEAVKATRSHWVVMEETPWFTQEPEFLRGIIPLYDKITP